MHDAQLLPMPDVVQITLDGLHATEL